MRKVAKYLFSSLILICSILLGAGLKLSESLYAQEETNFVPSYFSVKKTDNTLVSNGGTAFLSGGDTLLVSLNLNGSALISDITPYILLNDTPLSNVDIEKMASVNADNEVEYAIKENEESEGSYYFVFNISGQKIFNNTRSDGTNLYGKLDLTFSYHESVDGLVVNRTFNFSFYLLKSDDYNLAKYKIENAYAKGSAIGYNNDYIYEFESAQLPTLTYDARFFDLSITKTALGETTKYLNINYRGENLNLGNDIVYVSNNGSIVSVVFSDLADYIIRYSYIHLSNNKATVLLDRTASSELSASDRLAVTGFTLNYTENDERKEFKNVSSKGEILCDRTDFTYLYNSNLTEELAVTDLLGKVDNYLSTKGISLSTTNQAPLQIEFTKQIDFQNSYIQKLTVNEGALSLSGEKILLENEFITYEGKYLLKVQALDGTYQFFVFEKNSSVPSFVTMSYDRVLNKEIEELSTGDYTNQKVIVKYSFTPSIFDTKTKIVVQQFDYNRVSLIRETVISTNELSNVFTENGYYVVALYYGNKQSPTATSSFVIDNMEINDFSVFNVVSVGGDRYAKTNEVNFLTNAPIALFWNDKLSGATVSCDYKYFKLETIEEDYLDYFNTSDYLKNFYSQHNNYSIPTLNYINADLSTITTPYIKPSNSSYISSVSVFDTTKAGMYIFRLKDDCGQEKYFCIVIDNTAPVVLQTNVDGNFVKVEDINTVSNDTTVYWGKQKIIKMQNFDLNTDSEWIKPLKENYSSYFARYTLVNSTDYYFEVNVNSDVYRSVGGESAKIIPQAEIKEYGTTIKFLDENGKANEQQYIFYFRDESNLLTGSSNEENYTRYASNVYSVKVTSDAARLEVYYKTNDKNNSLVLSSYNKEGLDEEGYSLKNQYYQPTNKLTFNDDKVLYLDFFSQPNEDVIEINSVVVDYYPFTRKNVSSFYYSEYDSTTTPITIYNHNEDGVLTNNLTTFNSLTGKQEWKVNTYYNNQYKKEMTREGKYVVKRVYKVLDETLNTTNKNYDYITREFTFYVDTNSIITSPEVVEGEKVQSIVGGGIKVKITNSYFTETYLAQNYSTRSKNALSTHEGSVYEIFKTNKLPVKIMIPYYKYGYETEAGNSFEASNPMYFDENDKLNSLIVYNTLNIAIYKYQRLNDVETGNYDELVYQNTNPTVNNGYISLPELVAGGYYEVVISQLDPTAPEYVFLFHISEEAPQFTLGSDKNIEFQSLNLDSGTQYYTSSKSFRVSWKDSVNPYMAKIAHNGISFYASYNDGSTSSLISVSELEIKEGESERDFYVDIDLTKYPQIDVNNVYSIFVTARFETIEENGEGYFVGNYQTTKELVIDTTAPYESISALLDSSGMKAFEALIRVNDGYNTVTNTEGLFRNFAFAVDKSLAKELIKINKTTGLHAYNVWYRSVEKYNVSHSDETDPNGFVASSTYKVLDLNEFNSMYNNHYYEIIESDLAGNIAVYTIYLTDYSKEQQDKTIISWTTPVKENEEQLILLKDYSNDFEIYSKRSFNIKNITLFKSSTNSGYPWYNLTIKGTTYFHSPYLAGNQVATYNGDLFDIEDITRLDVRDEMQTIVISNQPYFNETTIHIGVISESKTLSYLHFSELNLSKDEDGNYSFTDLNGNTVKAKEGLLVEIPQGKNRANIYATLVTVIYNDTKQLSITVPLDSEEALSNVVGAENIRVIGYRSGSKLYAVIYIVRPIDNTYYVYQVTDNFGQIYAPKTYIFGAEVAKENFISDVPLASRIDGNDEWYYSTKSISFEFNREKNYVVFKALNINGIVKDVSTKDASAKAELYSSGIILENVSSVVYKVTVLSHTETSSNGIIGGKRVVQFVIYNNITVDIDGFDNSGRNCTFVINNTTPEINLFGKNNENLNAILGNVGMIVGPPVTIKFVDTSNEEYPNIVYLQNRDLNTTEVISSGHIVAEPGNYSILIGYTSDSIFAGVNYFKRINFKLSDEAVEFYAVYVDGSEKISTPTGNPFEIQGVDASTKDVIYTHYIVNGPYEIYCNEGQKIEAIRQTQYNLPSTTIYKITNHNADAVGYNLNYYETLIAITIIEKTNSILDKFAYIEPEGTSLTLYDKLEVNSNTNKENHTVVIEKGSSYEAVATYSYNSYYGIKENIVTAIVTDENGARLNPRTETIGETTYIYFDMSGYYRVKFVDLAGNKQLFNITDSFEITYLSSVIFNINDGRPVNNAIYDNSKPVIVSIPTSSRALYDNRIVPTIHVERNGEAFTPDASANNTIYTFKKSGLYKIWFSAVVGGKPVREEAYYFTIINSSESRWAFEMQEYASYYIDKIVRDGVDILPSLLSNPTIGTHISVEDENGETVTRLKNILISLYDEQTGAGRYYLEIKTNDTNNQTFGFSFWINNVEPPISISLKEGETTTGDIIVRFSKTNLYNEAGECVLRINGYNDLIINAETVKQAQADNTDIVNLKITEANTYYIQLYSESDKLLYSYTVTKKAPLNAISIIIIIVVTLGVGGLTTMFILLRKKMKIR